MTQREAKRVQACLVVHIPNLQGLKCQNKPWVVAVEDESLVEHYDISTLKVINLV